MQRVCNWWFQYISIGLKTAFNVPAFIFSRLKDVRVSHFSVEVISSVGVTRFCFDHFCFSGFNSLFKKFRWILSRALVVSLDTGSCSPLYPL